MSSVSFPVCTGWSLMYMLHMWHEYALTPPDMHIKHWAYMPTLVGIFVSRTHLAITEVIVGCIVGYICKNV